MIERHLSPTCGADVAIFTRQGRGNVRRTLAYGDVAVMTSAAHRGSLAMGKRRDQRQPAGVAVTGFTSIRG